MGFIAMFGLIMLSEKLLEETVMMKIGIEFTTQTLVLGLITGIFIPFASNIVPMKQALSNSLRNSLDKLRPSIDDVEVEMVRLEMQGMSTKQVSMSLFIIGFGLLSYYYIPQAAITKDTQGFLILLNGMLLLIILGLTFLAQLLMPYIEIGLLNLFLWINP